MSSDKAYKNMDFLMSREARTIRMLAEYLEPQTRFRRYRVTDTVVFFGSARALPREDAEKLVAEAKGADQAERAQHELRLSSYYEDARRLAYLLTNWSKGLELPSKRFIVCSSEPVISPN